MDNQNQKHGLNTRETDGKRWRIVMVEKPESLDSSEFDSLEISERGLWKKPIISISKGTPTSAVQESVNLIGKTLSAIVAM